MEAVRPNHKIQLKSICDQSRIHHNFLHRYTYVKTLFLNEIFLRLFIFLKASNCNASLNHVFIFLANYAVHVARRIEICLKQISFQLLQVSSLEFTRECVTKIRGKLNQYASRVLFREFFSNIILHIFKRHFQILKKRLCPQIFDSCKSKLVFYPLFCSFEEESSKTIVGISQKVGISQHE